MGRKKIFELCYWLRKQSPERQARILQYISKKRTAVLDLIMVKTSFELYDTLDEPSQDLADERIEAMINNGRLYCEALMFVLAQAGIQALEAKMVAMMELVSEMVRVNQQYKAETYVGDAMKNLANLDMEKFAKR